MAGVTDTNPVAQAAPAPVTRMFGWFVLAAMVTYLINVVLTFGFGLPGAGSLVGWD